MMPSQISGQIAADRLSWVDRMLETIRELPLDDRDAFFADERNIWTADSCLRRALEALFDLGRHILSRGFGEAPSEYKEVATLLGKYDVLKPVEASLLRVLAGYRNRLVHFYHEVNAQELFDICARDLNDVEQIANAYRRWIQQHPDKIDGTL